MNRVFSTVTACLLFAVLLESASTPRCYRLGMDEFDDGQTPSRRRSYSAPPFTVQHQKETHHAISEVTLWMIQIMQSRHLRRAPTKTSVETNSGFIGTRILVMLQNRKRNESRDYLPSDFYPLIGDFCYNEIRSLFHIFTSPEDRESILGFSSYEEMNEVHPSTMQKVRYLQSLRTDGDELGEDDIYEPGEDDIFVFNDHETSILRIIMPVEEERDYRNGSIVFPHSINWKAFSQLRCLEQVVLSTRCTSFKLNISMKDINHLPPSIQKLAISGHYWIGHDLNLADLPRGLKSFQAIGCEGMDGVLDLWAPDSKLEHVDVNNAKFKKFKGWGYLPSNVHWLSISDGRDIAERTPQHERLAYYRFEREKGIY